MNPLDATSYRIFRPADAPRPVAEAPFCSPINSRPLRPALDCLIDADQCFAFRQICGLYCLAPEDGIFVGTGV